MGENGNHRPFGGAWDPPRTLLHDIRAYADRAVTENVETTLARESGLSRID